MGSSGAVEGSAVRTLLLPTTTLQPSSGGTALPAWMSLVLTEQCPGNGTHWATAPAREEVGGPEVLARRAGQLLDLVILPALLILFIIFMPCLVFPRGYEAILCYEHSHCSASNLQGFSACPALSPPTDPASKSYNCGMLHPDLMVPWSPGAPLLTGYPAVIPELCPATATWVWSSSRRPLTLWSLCQHYGTAQHRVLPGGQRELLGSSMCPPPLGLH